MKAASHTLRRLSSIGDFRACVALQEETWGAGFSERVPTAILKVGQRVGGVSAGAFDEGGRLDGFVFGLTGVDLDGSPVHWSDMLAVRASSQGHGLGVRLKAFQRDLVMERGVRRMLWTFDPLRARNAHFNLNKLGAVVGEYQRDMYGETDSVLHRGIGTDRFVATWALDAPRVRARLAEALRGRAAADHDVSREPGSPTTESDAAHAGPVLPSAADPALVGQVGAGGLPEPGPVRTGLHSSRITVDVPADIEPVMERAPDLAVRWRYATREAFEHYLDRGYEVRATVSGAAVATYLLALPDPADEGEDG